LYGLHATSNALTSLDLSNNSALYFIDCSNNLLNSLNIQNGNNMDITNFSAINNPSLTCIQVDDVSYMQINYSSSIDATASYNTICGPCNVYIPDAAFKNALLSNNAINTNSNSEIECSEAQAYTGFLMLAANNINDLTGIESFINLTGLNCSANSLSSIDLSGNSALTDLRCVNNQLTSLEISYCPSLTKLYAWNNQITDISFLDNPNLDTVDISFNQFTALDLSDNGALRSLNCNFNNVDTLDLSSNTLLGELFCSNNNLAHINIQNGNNNNLTNFIANNNANGMCVKVDDVAIMQTNWPNGIDIGANYSETCGPCIVYIPDANFKSALVSNLTINTNGNAEIECSEAAAYNSFINVSNLNISDLMGIEAFAGITMLNCSVNQLSNLDLSANTALINLNCTGNNIINLNISNCLNLVQLYCSVNQITTLNLSNHFYLEQILCNDNALTTLNIQNGFNTNLSNFLATANPDLLCIAVDNVNDMTTNWPNAIDGLTAYNLNCSVCTVNIPDANFKAVLLANPYINLNSNSEIECSEASNFTGALFIQNLNISDLTGIEYFTFLTQLDCNSNQIATLDLSANTSLFFIDAHNNLLTDVSLPSGTALGEVILANNLLTNIDVSSNSYLSYLDCNTNQLTSLSVLNNSYLSYLYCNANQIVNLDLSNNGNLLELICSNNALSQLNLQNGNNQNLIVFNASNNPNLTCVQVDSLAFMNTNFINGLDLGANFNLNCAGACTVTIPDTNFKNALVNNAAINTNGNAEIECAEAAAYNGIMNLNSLSITNLTGIEAFTSLTELQCVNNNIPTIDLSANVALVNLNVNTSHVSSLNITNNSSLVELRCQNNQLTNLNLTNNSALNLLYCFNNNLTSLNISNNNLLSEIDCRNNAIVSLNTNNLSYLTYLDCSVNQLQYLDFSSNIYLNELYCQENALISLNIQNGNNDNFLYFDATANSALTCVQVDDVTYMNTNWISAIDATASYNTSCSACIVTIPDLIFKNALVTNFAINTNGNSEIECSEAVNYADTIYVTDLGIDDLTGIEAFISITGLVCNLNNLTSLDLSSNTALQFLHAYDNQLTSLNVTNNPALINLWISNNNLDSLDVTHNLMLEGLACFNNNFTNIDVTHNLALKDFRCAFNPLTTVDVSNNTQLELWYTGNCLINTLDLSNNLMLKQLDCGPNQLTTLDLSNNTALMTLEAGQNDLVALDVSNNTALSTIYVNGNALTSLNISNGNNANLSAFSAVNNPNLTCIQVDNVSLMNSNWSAAKDATASYNTNCPVSCPAIPIAFNATSTSITATPMNAVFSNATPNLLNYNFVWYFGDGSMLASNDASITHTYYYNGVYAVTLIAYDINTGCSDTLYQLNYMTCNATGALSCNHTIALNPSGVINACQGSIVPIASTTNLTTATYQWNRNGVIIGGASQENYYVDANGNYTLTVFNAQGCPITSSPVQVNYSLQSSVPPIISATGTANACGDVNVMLTAAGSFSNYLWSNGQTGNNINVTQGGSYTVIGQSPACDAVSLAYNIAGSVAPVPPICMVTVDETDNRNIVIWEKPVSLAIDSFLVLREEMNNPGIYHIIGAQSYVELSEFKDLGADANASAYRYKLAVMDTCGGITIPSDEQRSMHLDVAQGNSVLARQLTWNVYQGQPQAFNYYLIYRETSPGSSILALIDSVPSTQTWYYDNSLTNILDTARAYKVAYRVSSPCVSSRAQNDICSSNVIANERLMVDGLKSISDQAFRWTIAPNPNDGKFVLQTTAQGNIQLSVFNLIGEELYHQQINSPQTTIDLRALSNGVYMLNLNDGKSSVTKRLVVTK
jgi:Leucine-rich repeat (LRR) protein